MGSTIINETKKELQWFVDRIGSVVYQYHQSNDMIVYNRLPIYSSLGCQSLFESQDNGIAYSDKHIDNSISSDFFIDKNPEVKTLKSGIATVLDEDSYYGPTPEGNIVARINIFMGIMGPVRFREFVQYLHDYTGKVIFKLDEEAQQKAEA